MLKSGRPSRTKSTSAALALGCETTLIFSTGSSYGAVLRVHHLYELEFPDAQDGVVGERVALLLHLLAPGLAVVPSERLGVVPEPLAPDDARGRESEGGLVDGDHPHAAAGVIVLVHDVDRLAPARHDLGELFFGVVRAGGAGCGLLAVDDLPDQALPWPPVPIPPELKPVVRHGRASRPARRGRSCPRPSLLP